MPFDGTRFIQHAKFVMQQHDISEHDIKRVILDHVHHDTREILSKYTEYKPIIDVLINMFGHPVILDDEDLVLYQEIGTLKPYYDSYKTHLVPYDTFLDYLLDQGSPHAIAQLSYVVKHLWLHNPGRDDDLKTLIKKLDTVFGAHVVDFPGSAFAKQFKLDDPSVAEIDELPAAMVILDINHELRDNHKDLHTLNKTGFWVAFSELGKFINDDCEAALMCLNEIYELVLYDKRLDNKDGADQLKRLILKVLKVYTLKYGKVPGITAYPVFEHMVDTDSINTEVSRSHEKIRSEMNTTLDDATKAILSRTSLDKQVKKFIEAFEVLTENETNKHLHNPKIETLVKEVIDRAHQDHVVLFWFVYHAHEHHKDFLKNYLPETLSNKKAVIYLSKWGAWLKAKDVSPKFREIFETVMVMNCLGSYPALFGRLLDKLSSMARDKQTTRVWQTMITELIKSLAGVPRAAVAAWYSGSKQDRTLLEID